MKTTTLLIAIACTSMSLFGANYYVKESASGTNNGSDWTNAYNVLDSALNKAISGDSIFVAKGFYTPDPLSRDNTFYLISGVTILGGFDGTTSVNATTIDSRDFNTNTSILSGDLNRNDDGFENNTDNSIHVVNGSGVTSLAVLDGFTIKGGNADGSYPNYYGAGIYINQGQPSLKNLTIIFNSSDREGGGIYLYRANPVLINLTIAYNQSIYSEGGGAYLDYNSEPTVTNSIIALNSSQDGSQIQFGTLSNAIFQYSIVVGSGGSSSWNSDFNTDNGNNLDVDPLIYTSDSVSYIFYEGSPAMGSGNSTDGNNIGSYQGSNTQALPNPIYVKNDATGTSTGESWANAFTNIQTAVDAAIKYQTLYIAQGTYTPHQSDRTAKFEISKDIKLIAGFIGNETSINETTIKNRDLFTNKTILSGDLSGNDNGLVNNTENSYQVVKISNVSSYCELNGLTIMGGNGYASGAGLHNSYASPTLKNLVICYNYTTQDGAGIFNEYSNPKIINTTIAGNEVDSYQRGVSIYNEYSNPEIINTIMWGNTFDYIDEVYGYGGTPKFTNCLISGSGGSSDWDQYFGTDGGNNIGEAPLLASVGQGNFKLLTGSPAIDGGNASYGDNIGAYQGSGIDGTGIYVSKSYLNFLDLHTNENHIDSLTVSGYTLGSNITVSSTSPFEISLDKQTYSTSLNINIDNDGDVNSTTLYIKYFTTTTGYSDNVITLSATNADNIIVKPEGRGVVPQIWVDNDNMYLRDTLINVATQQDSLQFSAEYLKGEVKIKVNPPFQLSKISGDFSGTTDSISFSPIDGEIDYTYFYIRMLSAEKGAAIDTIYLETEGASYASKIRIKSSAYSTPERIYVKKDASGNNDGTNWSNAYTNLHSALQKAVFADTVLIAKGTYYPHDSLETVSFEINNGVKLIGSLVGNETIIDSTVLADRDLYNNATILSGDIDHNDEARSNNNYNSDYVLIVDHADTTTIIDGITIASAEEYSGYGLKNLYSASIFKNIVFVYNDAGDTGGAMYNYFSTSKFINVTIFQNGCGYNDYGAAMHNFSSSTTFINTLIWDNNSDNNIDIYNENGSVTTFEHCLIQFSGGSSSWYANGTDGGNNIDVDPEFVDSYGADFRLWDNSPALQVGNSAYGANIGAFQHVGLPVSTITSSAVSFDFGTVVLDASSEPVSFTVSGKNLLEEIQIIAPEQFEISLTADDFTGKTDTLNLGLVSDSVPTTTIYARFSPLNFGTYLNKVISISSKGAFRSVYLTGNSPKPTFFYVDSIATGKETGTSWANAYTELRDAFAIIAVGDTIVVAKGTYTPSISNKEAYFEILNDLKLYGGFAGDETVFDSVALSLRDFELNTTILSGDLNADDDNGGNNSENSYNILVADAQLVGNINNGTIIDGFTITKGNAVGNGLGEYQNYGPAVKNIGSAYDICNPVYRNIIIINNVGKYGGGMANVIRSTGGVCSPTLENIKFIKNKVPDGGIGGALLNNAFLGTVSPKLNNILFDGNYSSNSSGVINSYGGAVYNWGSGTTSEGGTCNPEFKNVVFVNNSTGYQGSAVYNRAGTYNSDLNHGKGNCSPIFINCTFAENNASVIFNYGAGGVCNPTLINTILWNNASSEMTSIYGATPVVSYSLIEGSNGSGASWNTAYGTDGGNNIDTLPMLAAPKSGNVNLISGSPAIGAGDITYGNNIGYYQESGLPEPVLSIEGTLSNFGSIDLGLYSSEKNYSLSGSNLVDNVTITAPENFEISITSNGYTGINGNSIVLTPADGSISSTTIYVRMSPETVGVLTDSITHVTSGIFTAYNAVAGTGLEVPFVTISPANLDFGNVATNEYNNSDMSVTLEGSYLTDDVIIVAPDGFLLSTQSGYGFEGEDTISFSPVNKIIDPVAFFIQFSPKELKEYSDTIKVMSNGAITRKIAVTGNGIMNPELIIEDNIIACVGQTEIKIPFIINDDNLETIIISATSYNQSMIPNDSISFIGTDSSRTMIIKPLSTYSGSVNIQISVQDQDNYTVSEYIYINFVTSMEDYLYLEMCEGDSLLINEVYVFEDGEYTENLTSVGGCDSIVTYYVSINPAPYVDLGEDLEYSGDEEIYINSDAYGYEYYSWNIDTSWHEPYYYTSTNDLGVGVHEITLEVRNYSGCETIDTVYITVTNISGLLNSKINDLSIYPTPSNGKVYINFDDIIYETLTVDIYNTSGVLLMSNELNNAKGVEELNLTSLSKGMYLIQLSSDGINIGKSKILIE